MVFSGVLEFSGIPDFFVVVYRRKPPVTGFAGFNRNLGENGAIA